jgi:copper homeostasis protein (lipoprotein)
MKRILLNVCYLLLVLTACTKSTEKKQDIQDKAHIDLSVYTGEIPCADCEGIRLILGLKLEDAANGSGKYELTYIYKGKTPENKFVQTGNYNIEKALSDIGSSRIYVLDWDKIKEERKYFAEYNNDPSTIYMLGQDKQPIDSQFNYKLKRIEGK